MSVKKIVIFGAGKIGRSFIGQLFSRGGYEVVFIDIFKPVIEALNARNNYNVIIKAEKEYVLNIKNVRGVFAGDKQKVIDEITTAGIVAVSIGQNGLPAIMPLIAKALINKFEQNNALALDIIIAENLRNASEYFEHELTGLLPAYYPFNQLVGLVETSIGKMVPIMLNKDIEEDILQVFAEPYNTLILDKKAFKNPIPNIEGLAPKNNMKAWVDRKLFIHNLGHATAAYLGYLKNPKFIYMHQALAVTEVYSTTRETMLQAAEILLLKYPDEFTLIDLTEHIDDLLTRFQNVALGDTVYRVGCDLMRKLGPDDRLAGAITQAIELNLPYDRVLQALISGCLFRADDENGNRLPDDIKFTDIYKKGFSEVFKKVCGFEENTINHLIKFIQPALNK